MNNKHSSILILTLVGLLATPIVMSGDAEDAEAAVAYRQSYMSSIGGHFGAVRNLASGDVSHEGDLKMHADALAALTRNLVKVFPEGSGAGETDAKPDIWANWDEFAARARDAENAAAAFAAAAAGDDAAAIGASLKDLGGACKGCHKKFKVKR